LPVGLLIPASKSDVDELAFAGLVAVDSRHDAERG
jgi:hypothetical protein